MNMIDLYPKNLFIWTELLIKEATSYSRCPKISYTKVSDKMAWANSTDLDQTEEAVWSGSTLFTTPPSI